MLSYPPTLSVIRRCLFAVAVCLGCTQVGIADETKLDPAKVEFFENKIRPILVEHCYECHASATGDNSGDLRLDTAEALLKGGARGLSIIQGNPNDSLLLKAVLYDIPDLQMPPNGKLPQNVIDDLRLWIEQGAVDPRTNDAANAKPAASRDELAAKHWAFQPLPAAERPSGSFAQPSTIDVLLGEQLRQKNVAANASASPQELILRLHNDLTGLRPAWEPFQAMAQQPIENCEAWVDGLLQSPHFGERMARRWMDVSRYADNKGYVFEEDREYAHAWRYREWLIQSFNQDMPFDQFVSYQIAADKLESTPESKNLDAMGFLTLGRRFLNNENDIADDRIDVVTRGLLGLSVACARCHDHKFDAIGMDDYYSMHAVMVSHKEPKDEPGPLRMVDSDSIRPAVIFKRGNPGLHGDTVPKKFVKFLTPVSRPMDNGSGRLDMAQAITDPKNPLTARVYVNRIWGWVMGTPLVDTPSDFGIRCDAPVQRALLDRLAADFVADGWSTKRLVKRIVMSQAYRRSSKHSEAAYAIDPENTLWWRGNRKRLDFESMRDAILVASGQFEPTVGGASIKMIDPPFSNRRTLYAYIDRQNLPGVFRSFDFASPDTHVPNRLATTVPQQGLFMMNSPMIDHYASQFAQRCLEYSEPGLAGDSSIDQKAATKVDFAFRSILLRMPADSERQQSLAYLKENAANPNDLATWPWSDFAKALLSTNEFNFVD